MGEEGWMEGGERRKKRGKRRKKKIKREMGKTKSQSVIKLQCILRTGMGLTQPSEEKKHAKLALNAPSAATS